ncbi:hypothetical protein [Photobacterium kasasachensis]|uniref:hypothetical protein n=1 Tax=Photobacterium kasasachensis TaxID=2910240 RepID=UPI003D102030
MRNLDKPLFWVYKRTKESILSSVKGVFLSILLIFTFSVLIEVSGVFSPLWAGIIMILLSMIPTLSIGLIAIKLKFRKTANPIPRAEIAYARQSGHFMNAENIVRSLASVCFSLMIYVWFAMLVMMFVVMPVFNFMLA